MKRRAAQPPRGPYTTPLRQLRRRLTEWAAREGPVLHTPPLTCDVAIHLDGWLHHR